MFVKPSLKAISLAVCVATSSLLAPHGLAQEVAEADNEAAFQSWLLEFRSEALERGISEQTLDEVLPQISQQRQVIHQDRNQAEFDNTYSRYLQRVNNNRIEAGKELMAEHGDMIREVSAHYGVQGDWKAITVLSQSPSLCSASSLLWPLMVGVATCFAMN